MNAVTDGFTAADRERFRNLLELAARTPFQGERENAIAAAERLAQRHGMTMEEAAVSDRPPRPEAEPIRPPPDPVWAAVLRSAHLTDAFIAADKRRREEALRAAQARGLDQEHQRLHRPPPPRASRSSRQRRNPAGLARVLLNETTLSLQSISDITGLDIYTVTALKLKLRATA